MKCKSFRRWLHESCKKKRRTLWRLTGSIMYTWHRFPEAVLNLTWNLNQKGRFLGDPWEGHSCVGTQWGWHASWPRQSAAEAASLCWQNWGHPCLPWPKVHSWRMVMVSTIQWHDLMSRNLQHIYGSAAWLQSRDDGVVNKETGKPGTPVGDQCLYTEFPGVILPCWKETTVASAIQIKNWYFITWYIEQDTKQQPITDPLWIHTVQL